MRRESIWSKGAMMCLGLIIASACGCRTASKMPGMSWMDRTSSAELASRAEPVMPPPPSEMSSPRGGPTPGTSAGSGTQVAQADGAYQNTGMPQAVPAGYNSNAYAASGAAPTQPTSGQVGGSQQGFYNPEYPGGSGASATAATVPPIGTPPAADSQYGSGSRYGDPTSGSPYAGAAGYTADASVTPGYGSSNTYGGSSTQVSPVGAASTYGDSGGSTYGSSPASSPSYGSSTYGGGSPSSYSSGGAVSGGYSTGASTAPARTPEPFQPGSTGTYEPGSTGSSSGMTAPRARSNYGPTIPASYEEEISDGGAGYPSFQGSAASHHSSATS